MIASPDWTALRERMVHEQLQLRGIADPRVLDAMRAVPRHAFVPDTIREHAYEDTPLPIGHGQTISQPFIVALMCERAELTPASRVLEVGAGCGYEAAVLSELAYEVIAIEIMAPLAREAAERLAGLGYENVRVRHGDGHRGAPDAAPFDAILVAAAPEHVPQALLDQLAPNGRLVVPVGGTEQELRVYRRTDGGIFMDRVCYVAFVPMTGRP